MDFHLLSRFIVGLFIGQYVCEKDKETLFFSFPINANIFITCSTEVRTNLLDRRLRISGVKNAKMS